MRTPVDFARCESIVAAEAMRIGRVRGYEREDLLQEGRLAAARCLARINLEIGTGPEYVRSSVRNAFISLKRYAHAAPRCPQSDTGRPMFLQGTSELRVLDHGMHPGMPQRTAEDEVADREAVAKIRAALGSQERFDWLYYAAVEGVSLATQRSLTKADKEQLRLLINAATAAITAQTIDNRVRHSQGATKEDTEMSYYAKLPPEHIIVQSDVYDCHTDGGNAQSYNPEFVRDQVSPYDNVTYKLRLCHVCPQKFSCLARKVDTQTGSAPSEISLDREVEAITLGLLTPLAAKDRLRQRTKLLLTGQAVPDYLRHDYVGLVDPEAQPVAAPPPSTSVKKNVPKLVQLEEEEPVEEAVQATAKKRGNPTANGGAKPKKLRKPASQPPAPVVEEKKAKLAKPKKAAAPVAAPPKAKAKKPVAAKPVAKPAPVKAKAKAAPKRTPAAGELTLNTGKPLPVPQTIDEDDMAYKIGLMRTKLGAPTDFQFKVGQQLVRKRRVKGDEVVVTIRANGFELDIGEENIGLFGSLTACAMYAERMMKSGNEFFHLANQNCTELRDAKGRVLLNRENCAFGSDK